MGRFDDDDDDDRPKRKKRQQTSDSDDQPLPRKNKKGKKNNKSSMSLGGVLAVVGGLLGLGIAAVVIVVFVWPGNRNANPAPNTGNPTAKADERPKKEIAPEIHGDRAVAINPDSPFQARLQVMANRKYAVSVTREAGDPKPSLELRIISDPREMMFDPKSVIKDGVREGSECTINFTAEKSGMLRILVKNKGPNLVVCRIKHDGENKNDPP